MSDELQRYTQAAMHGDRAEATRVVRLLEHERVPPSHIIRDLLALSQVDVGLGWQQHRWSVDDERRATAVTGAVLSEVLTDPPGSSADRGRFVMMCAAGEQHDLAARMASKLLGHQGWSVTNLGVAVPTADVIDRVVDLDPVVVGVSCSMPANLVGAAATIAALRARGIRVLAGGRAFGSTSRRARAVGANGWVDAVTAGIDLDDVVWDEPNLPDVHGPWAPMTARRVELARAALDVLLSVEPDADGGAVGAPTLDELALIVGAVAAADLCGDPEIVREHRVWLGDRMRSVRGDESAVDAAFLAVAAVVRPELPDGAAMLCDLSVASAG